MFKNKIVIKDDKIVYVGAFIDVGLWRSEDYYKSLFGNYVYCDIEECMTAEKIKDWHWEACEKNRKEVKENG